MKRESIVEALLSGDRIMVTHPRSGSSERTQFTLVDCGKSITKSQFGAISKNLCPVHDGLFGFSQTFEWCEE